MTETLTGTNRSAGVAYAQLLDGDSCSVPEHLRRESVLDPGPTLVPVESYTSRAFHDLEVEKLWKKVWQMACHEDDIPNVGDYVVYDVASLSFLVMRSAPDEFKAFYNACLHRGRLLKERSGQGAHELRCSFHGWCWNLDGSLKEIPCQWDFPEIQPADGHLPEVKLDRWGGFIFINPDPDAEPLSAHLGDLPDHFTTLPYERRYKEAHVAKILRCNWKVAQEAFMEAYHVVATHPQILDGIGDANSKYDAFQNYSRAITPNAVSSPHLEGIPDWEPLDDASPRKMRHPLSGAVYARQDDGLIEVTSREGQVGRFSATGAWVEGELTQADIHMCSWVGGAVPALVFRDSRRDTSDVAPQDSTAAARTATADAMRGLLRESLGDDVESVSDAELVDSIYFTLFPNFHPWGAFNRIVYRFRPNGDNSDESIMECMFFAPAPKGEPRPPAAPVHWLDPEDDWTEAPELGMLGKVFNQDTLNLPHVQRGLYATRESHVQFGNYGETKIRHFHQILEQYLAAE